MRQRTWAIAVALCAVAGCSAHNTSSPVLPQINTHANPRAVMSGSCDSAISANFNGTSISAGSTLWFSAVMKVSGVDSSPVTIYMTNSTISFTAGGTPTTVSVPDSSVTVAPGTSTATITYAPNGWVETVPYPFSGNVLLNAVEYPVSTALPGGIQNVRWSGHFTSSDTAVSVKWAWAASVYSSFSPDYNALGVKPVDANNTSQYLNSDHAGTPEHFKAYVTGGGMGGGGSNFTGGLSGTAAVAPCAQPTPTPSPTPTPTTAPIRGLYVADNGSASITTYAPGANGNVTPTNTIVGSNTRLGGPFGLAISAAGSTYVADIAADSIEVFAPGATGNASPSQYIQGSNTGLINPYMIALDANDNIYVTDAGTGSSFPPSITEYAPNANGNAAPTVTISGSNTGLDQPRGLALDAAGNIYVANFLGNSITEYAVGASGNATPIATIAGPDTGLQIPAGIALDRLGNIYVADYGVDAVLEFAVGANGDAFPIVTIQGSSTGLNLPEGVFVDSAGTIYASNANNNTITEYAAGSNGNASPSATIGGSNTLLNGPGGLASF